MVNNKIISRETNFADWYTSIVENAKLIMYSDIKGMMIFQPYGWSIWENIVKYLDNEFKKIDISNVYMPLLIPYSELNKEKEHVEGFSPEIFIVNKIGDKNLNEPYVIRPTSEILFCQYFKKTINSYNDLPLKLNQWTSVLRAEKTTRPFLRNSEFHWHETHCVFDDINEAKSFCYDFLELYANFVSNVLMIPIIKGQKTENEKFAGADYTLTIEAMMQDKQALQCATSHFLGQNFAKVYDIKYQSKDNNYLIPYTTSHGLSTRIIGAILMTHADDHGLVLPFKIAPIQIKINTLLSNKNELVNKLALEIGSKLENNYRVKYDFSDKGKGFKLSESEIKGIPLTIVIGPKDLENNQVIIYTRNNLNEIVVDINDVYKKLDELINQYDISLYNNAKNILDSNIIEVNNLDEFELAYKTNKWIKTWFSCDIDDEKTIKEKYGLTTRCIVNVDKIDHNCFYTNKKTNKQVIFARAY